VITNAPDVWSIDLNAKLGKHAVDTDEPSRVRAPLFSDEGIPSEIAAVEMGCEIDFINRVAVTHDRLETKNGVAIKHSIHSGLWKLTVVTRDTERLPLAALLSLDGKVVKSIRYLSYEVLEAVPDGLFEPPPGISLKRNDTRGTSGCVTRPPNNAVNGSVLARCRERHADPIKSAF
jgi:hypothetical protein